MEFCEFEAETLDGLAELATLLLLAVLFATTLDIVLELFPLLLAPPATELITCVCRFGNRSNCCLAAFKKDTKLNNFSHSMKVLESLE